MNFSVGCKRLFSINTHRPSVEITKPPARFFHDQEGRIVHHRIERELEKLNAFFRSQSEKGKASGIVRGKKKPANPQPRRGNGAIFALPDWVIVSKWDAWVKIRPAKARTPDALSAAIEKLEEFRAAGHDGNAIIANSLANGWQGLFPPDSKRAAHKSIAETNRIAGEEAQRRFEAEHGKE